MGQNNLEKISTGYSIRHISSAPIAVIFFLLFFHFDYFWEESQLYPKGE